LDGAKAGIFLFIAMKKHTLISSAQLSPVMSLYSFLISRAQNIKHKVIHNIIF